MKKTLINILLLFLPVLGPFIVIVKGLINSFKLICRSLISAGKKVLFCILTYFIIELPILPAFCIFSYALQSQLIPDMGTVIMIAGIVGFFLSGALAIVIEEIIIRKSAKFQK